MTTPNPADIERWGDDARQNGKREGVLEAARWLRMRGDPKTAFALVTHIDEICGERPDVDVADIAQCANLETWKGPA